MSEFLSKLALANRYFFNTKYSDILVKAQEYYNKGDEIKAMKALSQLPDKTKLLRQLLKECRGKAMEKSLRKVTDGKITNFYGVLKSLYSLGTHILIELEKGNLEYRMLLEDVFLKIQAAMSSQK
jgi:hypothetical protein